MFNIVVKWFRESVTPAEQHVGVKRKASISITEHVSDAKRLQTTDIRCSSLQSTTPPSAHPPATNDQTLERKLSISTATVCSSAPIVVSPTLSSRGQSVSDILCPTCPTALEGADQGETPSPTPRPCEEHLDSWRDSSAALSATDTDEGTDPGDALPLPDLCEFHTVTSFSSSFEASSIEILQPTSTTRPSPPPPTLTTLRSDPTCHDRDGETPTCSQRLYHALTERYQLEMTRCQFVGLCAYLYALLRLGYPLETADLDAFVYAYPDYCTELPRLEEEQVRDGRTTITSYHEWFLGRKDHGDRTRRLLEASSLRELYAENVYAFTKTWFALQSMARLRRPE